METKTGYDLNAAMENWRQELAAQGNLTAEVQRELETHLCDAMAGFRQRGLSDEESFWLARKRVGQPQQLGEEFVKADPAKAWREPVFWAAVILFAIDLWSKFTAIAWGLVLTVATSYINSNGPLVSPFPDWVRFYLPLPSNINLLSLLFDVNSGRLFSFLSLVPVIGIGWLMARGRLSQKFSWIQSLFHSRRRFLFVSATLFSFYFLWLAIYLLRFAVHPGHLSLSDIMVSEFMSLLYPAILVAVIDWLLPTQNQTTTKHA